MAGTDEQLIERVRSVLAAPRPWSLTEAGDPVLRQPAARYDGQLPDDLLGELLDAMRRHLPGVGVGLAAPQAGNVQHVDEDPDSAPGCRCARSEQAS